MGRQFRQTFCSRRELSLMQRLLNLRRAYKVHRSSIMKNPLLFCGVCSLAFISACVASGANNTASNNANTGAANASPSPTAQTLTVVDRPQKIVDLMSSRGDQ